jgi:hypothetical protein
VREINRKLAVNYNREIYFYRGKEREGEKRE